MYNAPARWYGADGKPVAVVQSDIPKPEKTETTTPEEETRGVWGSPRRKRRVREVKSYSVDGSYQWVTDPYGRPPEDGSESPGSVLTEAPPDSPIGKLTYIALEKNWGITDTDLRKEGMTGFTKPRAGSGAVSPHAVVTSWKTERHNISVAIDATDSGVPHPDVLRLDPSGQEDFTNAYEVRRVANAYTFDEDCFRAAFVQPLNVNLGGKKIPLYFWSTYRKDPNSRKLVLNLGMGAEARCRFGSKTYWVRLVNGDSNLGVTDTARPRFTGNRIAHLGPGDSVFVATKDKDFKGGPRAFWGNPILVDGGLYDLTISEDGSSISTSPFSGKIGTLKIDQPHWRGWFVNKDRVLILSGTRDPVPVPIGGYSVLKYVQIYSALSRPEDSRAAGTPPGEERYGELVFWYGDSWASRQRTVDISEGKPADIQLGGPFPGNIQVSDASEDQTVCFFISLTDHGGTPAETCLRSKEYDSLGPPGPTLEVRDASGKVVDRVGTSHIKSGNCMGVMPRPRGLKGTFTVTAAADGAFSISASQATFNLD